jgi:hypothetical protein
MCNGLHFVSRPAIGFTRIWRVARALADDHLKRFGVPRSLRLVRKGRVPAGCQSTYLSNPNSKRQRLLSYDCTYSTVHTLTT